MNAITGGGGAAARALRHNEGMSWLSRRRATQSRARALRMAGLCRSCGHDWSEHPGAWPDSDETCGECRYELDHDQRESDAPACIAQCPLLTHAQVQALGEVWGRIPRDESPPSTDSASAWVELDSWLAGVLSSQAVSPHALSWLHEIALAREAAPPIRDAIRDVENIVQTDTGPS